MRVARILSPPDAGQPTEPEWHEAMWTVAASVNDHARPDATANAQRNLEDLARHFPGLLNLLKQNRGEWLISRVGRYYAFLIDPSMDAAEDLIDAVEPDSEELRFPRVWLPWLRCMSWIAARMDQMDLIQRVQEKIDSLQLAVPGRMDPRTEFAQACQDEIHRRIRPWVALAQLANDYVETSERMKPGRDRAVAMTEIAQKMRPLADALDRADLLRLLPDPHPGRRLIAYAVLTAQPDSAFRAPLIAALIPESQPFMQYRGLEALRAIVANGPPIDPDERATLELLGNSLSQSIHRAGVLRDILKIAKLPPQPLGGKRILWVDDHPKNIENLAEEFSAEGALVRTVTTTEAVFSELSKSRFDLVISDLNREGMVPNLRRSGISVPAVIYSGDLTEQRISRAALLRIPCFGSAAALRAALAEWNWQVQRLVPARWVLVAGTGRAEGLSAAAQNGAELTALAVALQESGLITGGWPGVDHIAAREFAKVTEARGAAVDSFLLHVMDGSGAPDFMRGKVETYSTGVGMTESAKRADAVVLVAGEGGTWEIFRTALSLGKPVIPLAGSGGDAEKAWRLLRIAPGAAHLQSPLLSLVEKTEALQAGLGALTADLENPPDLTIGAGPFIVELVTTILPLAAEYMQPVSVGEFERTASRIRKQLQTWSDFLEDAIPVLLGDASPERRVTGYFAFQTNPQPEQIPALMECLSVEVKEIEAGRETRPFFQWLNSIYTCLKKPLLREFLPQTLGRELRAILALFERRNDVDPDGQCKNFLRSVLSTLRAE